LTGSIRFITIKKWPAFYWATLYIRVSITFETFGISNKLLSLVGNAG